MIPAKSPNPETPPTNRYPPLSPTITESGLTSPKQHSLRGNWLLSEVGGAGHQSSDPAVLSVSSGSASTPRLTAVEVPSILKQKNRGHDNLELRAHIKVSLFRVSGRNEHRLQLPTCFLATS
ncbi:unnamed protein product [Lota lota]